jgi:hypothetical protein
MIVVTGRGAREARVSVVRTVKKIGGEILLDADHAPGILFRDVSKKAKLFERISLMRGVGGNGTFYLLGNMGGEIGAEVDGDMGHVGVDIHAKSRQS